MVVQKRKKKKKIVRKSKKQGDSNELFLPGNDSQNSSTENFSKIHPNFGGIEIHNGCSKTQKKLQTFFTFLNI